MFSSSPGRSTRAESAAIGEKAGVAPQQFVDELTANSSRSWEKLEVKYDGWAATTDPLHKKCVQGMLQRLYDGKAITKTNRRATTASARSNS
jgi:methionyl-tRNA synthetase